MRNAATKLLLAALADCDAALFATGLDGIMVLEEVHRCLAACLLRFDVRLSRSMVDELRSMKPSPDFGENCSDKVGHIVAPVPRFALPETGCLFSGHGPASRDDSAVKIVATCPWL